MAKHFVLRMRRDLSGPVEPAMWPQSVDLRTLTAKPDMKRVKAAHAVLTAGFWEGGGGAPIYRKWWPRLRKDSEYDPELVFLAVERGDLVGMAQCWTSAFVKDLAVPPEARRRGIGRALMLTAFHAFARRGATHVDLKVREENDTAIALYRSLGMTVIDRQQG